MRIFYLACVDINIENADSRHVMEICQSWAQSGHEVILFVPKVEPYRHPTPVHIKYIRTGTRSIFLNYAIFYLVLIPHLLAAASKGKPDFVYSRYIPTELPAALMIRLCRWPYRVEYNGAVADEWRLKKRPEFLVKIIEILEWVGLRLAGKIITVTPGLKQYLMTRFGLAAEAIQVLGNGVNLELSRPRDQQDCKKRLGLRQDWDYLIFMGSLQAWHGATRLGSILELLRRCNEKIGMLIVGSGPLEKEIQQDFRDRGLDGQTVFTGRVHHEKVGDYIGAASICLAPYPDSIVSRHGLSPLKILEYCANGRPVVTTSAGGLDRFINEQDIGIAVTENTDQALAAAVAALLANRERLQTCGNRARKVVEEKHSWSVVAEKLLAGLTAEGREARVGATPC